MFFLNKGESMKIILIAGKAQSGKTTAANILKNLCKEKNLRACITEYSKYIKMFAKELTDWNGEIASKPRAFLQDFGSFVRQNKDEDFFIKRMKEDISIYSSFVDVLIISDIRFPREITSLKEYHPLTIKVDNHFEEKSLTKAEEAHETEHALDNFFDFDYSIKDKSLNEMREILKKIVEEEL